MSAMQTYEDYLRGQVERGQYGVAIIQAQIALDIAEYIEKHRQPTIEPERKKGHWIEYIPEHGKCPFCGNQVDLLGGKINNFCGECGADMRGEQNEKNGI